MTHRKKTPTKSQPQSSNLQNLSAAFAAQSAPRSVSKHSPSDSSSSLNSSPTQPQSLAPKREEKPGLFSSGIPAGIECIVRPSAYNSLSDLSKRQQKIVNTKRNAVSGTSTAPKSSKPYKLYTDGSYFYEFEKAGIGGYLLSPEGKTVFEFSKLLTNPKVFEKHEIMALEAGLLEAYNHGITHIHCYTDDQKMAQILNIRNPTLKAGYIQMNPYLEHANVLLRRFDQITFEYLPRKKNKRADRLSRAKLLKEISHLTRTVENALTVRNFHCVQQFSKNNAEQFSELKKEILPHLALNLNTLEETGERIFTVYTGEKQGNGYHSEFQFSSTLSDNWLEDALELVAKTLENFNTSLTQKAFANAHPQSMSTPTVPVNVLEVPKPSVIIALRDNKRVLDEFLRGRRPTDAKNEAQIKSIEVFEKACANFDKVVLHSDDTWLKTLF